MEQATFEEKQLAFSVMLQASSIFTDEEGSSWFAAIVALDAGASQDELTEEQQELIRRAKEAKLPEAVQRVNELMSAEEIAWFYRNISQQVA